MPRIGDDHSSTRPNTGDIYRRTVTNLTTRMSRGRSGSKDSGNGLLSNNRPAYRSAGEGYIQLLVVEVVAALVHDQGRLVQLWSD